MMPNAPHAVCGVRSGRSTGAEDDHGEGDSRRAGTVVDRQVTTLARTNRITRRALLIGAGVAAGAAIGATLVERALHHAPEGASAGPPYGIDNWPGLDWHLFSETSPWVAPLDKTSVDPRSDVYISSLRLGRPSGACGIETTLRLGVSALFRASDGSPLPDRPSRDALHVRATHRRSPDPRAERDATLRPLRRGGVRDRPGRRLYVPVPTHGRRRRSEDDQRLARVPPRDVRLRVQHGRGAADRACSRSAPRNWPPDT